MWAASLRRLALTSPGCASEEFPAVSVIRRLKRRCPVLDSSPGVVGQGADLASARAVARAGVVVIDSPSLSAARHRRALGVRTDRHSAHQEVRSAFSGYEEGRARRSSPGEEHMALTRRQ